MRKLLCWLDKNILKVGISFLLVFIPLYPKLPLLDIEHTWVYIRLEDFFVALLVFIFGIKLLQKKTTLKSPLTIPIFLYWLVGGLSLVYAILILHPNLPNFFPSVAFLHYLRRIEYMVCFFIALSTIESIKDVQRYILFFTFGVVSVILYGFGQRFFGLPAFSTMNEEYAKGVPLLLKPEDRVISTFAGHYDLGAYLVFVIAFLTSLILGLKSKWEKIALLTITIAAYLLLLFTASRVSFAVYLVTVALVLCIHKKKWLVIPVLALSILLVGQVRQASVRLGETFRVRKIVFDLKTGRPIAPFDELVTSPEEIELFSKPSKGKRVYGEELPLGSTFLEVPLLEQEEELLDVEKITLKPATEIGRLATISGQFLVKRALVYDIAFTTRLQGSWPQALQAFRRNIFFGSGYSSISLATDNSYLRALGETGLVGLISFLAILFSIFLISRQSIKKMRLKFNRSVIIGIAGGLFGLSLNAVLIDIFEASKVAYILWIWTGIMVGLFLLSFKKRRSLIEEGINFLQSKAVGVVVLFLISAFVFSPALSNYFTGSDFIWLKRAATTEFKGIRELLFSDKGVFRQPLTFSLFYLGRFLFGLKPEPYRLIIFSLHFLNGAMVYFIAHLLSQSYLVAFLFGLFFLTCPACGKSVFYLSASSGLFTTFFLFLSIFLFLRSRKDKRPLSYLECFAGLLFFVFGLKSWFTPFPMIAGLAFFSSIALNFLYRQIIFSGYGKARRFVGRGFILFVALAISSFYYQSVKKIDDMWREAGEIANETLRAISGRYQKFPPESTIYFVNLPEKIGQAWVFPEGVKEGLWLIYKDETLKVKRNNRLQAALDFKDKHENVYLFIYEGGDLKEVTRRENEKQ